MSLLKRVKDFFKKDAKGIKNSSAPFVFTSAGWSPSSTPSASPSPSAEFDESGLDIASTSAVWSYYNSAVSSASYYSSDNRVVTLSDETARSIKEKAEDDLLKRLEKEGLLKIRDDSELKEISSDRKLRKIKNDKL